MVVVESVRKFSWKVSWFLELLKYELLWGWVNNDLFHYSRKVFQFSFSTDFYQSKKIKILRDSSQASTQLLYEREKEIGLPFSQHLRPSFFASACLLLQQTESIISEIRCLKPSIGEIVREEASKCVGIPWFV